MNDLDTRVMEVIRNVVKFNKNIYTNTCLRELGYDSLKNVELVVTLEDELNITFDDSLLTQDKFETVQSVINLVKESV